MSPTSTEFATLYAATICGITPSPSQIIWDFRNTGLYHLVVVSGAHLIFCASLVDWIFFYVPERPRKALKFFVLTVYSLLSGLNPPVVRAWMGLVLAEANDHLDLNWNSLVSVLLSGLVCLAIFPSWWGSLSFLMSWSAAFALTLAPSALMKCVAVYIMMIVPMSALGINSPSTVLANWLLAPVMGFIMLPVSALPYIYEGILPFTDWVWRVLLAVIRWLSEHTISLGTVYSIPKEFMWMFLLSVQLGLHHWMVRVRRTQF